MEKSKNDFIAKKRIRIHNIVVVVVVAFFSGRREFIVLKLRRWMLSTHSHTLWISAERERMNERIAEKKMYIYVQSDGVYVDDPLKNAFFIFSSRLK